jgi:hypothetical protein
MNADYSFNGRLEYEMNRRLQPLVQIRSIKVAFLEGQNELAEPDVADITINLAKIFTVDRGSINAQPGILTIMRRLSLQIRCRNSLKRINWYSISI